MECFKQEDCRHKWQQQLLDPLTQGQPASKIIVVMVVAKDKNLC
jgi:hypothetical protein